MNRFRNLFLMTIIALAATAACSKGESPDTSAESDIAAPVSDAADAVPSGTVAASKPSPAASMTTSPGKPTAPISMRYEILGNPVVGQPVAVNVLVSSARGPVRVSYSINDQSAVMFQQNQVERLEIADPSLGTPQQLTVIPQREGRVYVNVSAAVDTENGELIKSMAIPIRVGKAVESPTINGELVETADGETVISMPAVEN